MIREHFECRQTITTILGDEASHIEAAKKGMTAARHELEEYLRLEPFFGTSYFPVSAGKNAPLIVQRMAEAALGADVGPMAAVAATVAWAGVEAMLDAGASYGLIDNGGDIVLVSDRPIRVGIYAGSAPSSGKSAFIVPPQKEILGICTSSATVGPSVSFGIADAVVVFSRNPAKADAWATAVCNVLRPDNPYALKPAPDICGIYAVIHDWIGTGGRLPEIVPAEVNTDLITKGER
jgi:ApbE superfamily uncharacterized protein (UPF0280 family)